MWKPFLENSCATLSTTLSHLPYCVKAYNSLNSKQSLSLKGEF